MNETPFSSELDTLVEACLDALLRGEITLEQVLQRYPQHAADLKPLLQMALLTSRLKAPQMSAERVQALDKRLRAQANKTSQPQPKIVIWQPLARLAAAVVIVALLAFGSGAGLVSASTDTLPGDALYPVKRAWESARVTFAPAGQQDDVWLEIARTRLAECIVLNEQQRLNEQALIDLYTATAQAIRTADTTTMSEVIVYAQEVQVTMATITPPPNAQLLYNDVWVMTTLKPDGTLPIPPEVPPSQQVDIIAPTLTPTIVLTPEATVEVTIEVTAEVTDEATQEATVELTVEITDEAEGTRTPRIPVTATRTPTFTPTATATPTGTLPSATPTLTPPPIGGQPPFGFVTLPPNVTATNVPQTPVFPTIDATVPIRDTQRAVYLTQTAGPPLMTPSSP